MVPKQSHMLYTCDKYVKNVDKLMTSILKRAGRFHICFHITILEDIFVHSVHRDLSYCTKKIPELVTSQHLCCYKQKSVSAV